MRVLVGLVLGVLVVAPRGVLGVDVIYVDDDAPLGGDGLSWETAFRYLQDGCDLAMSMPDPPERVLVAGGVYRPDIDEAGTRVADDATQSFTLPHGTSLIGGFDGVGTPGEATVLDGNLGDPDSRDDNAEVLLRMGGEPGVDEPFVARGWSLESLTIRSGLRGAELLGDGILVDGVAFVGNGCGDPLGCPVYDFMAGSLNIDVHAIGLDGVVVRDCEVRGSTGRSEIKMESDEIGFEPSVLVESCIFIENGLSENWWDGVRISGGLRESMRSVLVPEPFETIRVFESQFRDNLGSPNWILAVGSVARTVEIDSCTFEGNVLQGEYKCMDKAEPEPPKVILVYQSPYAPPVEAIVSNVRMSNTLDNKYDRYPIDELQGVGIAFDGHWTGVSHLTVSDCDIEAAAPNWTGISTSSKTNDGGIVTDVSRTRFAGLWRVGIFYGEIGNFDRCLIERCDHTWSCSSHLDGLFRCTSLTNSVLIGNRIDYGWIVEAESIAPSNTVWVGNVSGSSLLSPFSASLSDGACAGVANSIFYGNVSLDSAAPLPLTGQFNGTIQCADLRRCVVDPVNTILLDWTGVITDDPMFADPLGPDGLPATGDEDYSLLPGSPAIDAGHTRYAVGDLDLAGAPRVQSTDAGCVVDIGAYEFAGSPCSCPADLTTSDTNPGDPAFGLPDGYSNGADLSFYVEAWILRDPVADVTTTETNPGDENFGVPDGAINGADLSHYVELWIGGCVAG